ncbi:MAG: hypothetical protein IPL95_05320 [Saprospiraceae bacterium]|nr:hypothetical protein [Saprospiraceae bacterium]
MISQADWFIENNCNKPAANTFSCTYHSYRQLCVESRKYGWEIANILK